MPPLGIWEQDNQEFKVILSYSVQGQPRLSETQSQKRQNRAGEMAHWLRAHATLLEDLSSIPGNCIRQL